MTGNLIFKAFLWGKLKGGWDWGVGLLLAAEGFLFWGNLGSLSGGE